MRSEAGEMSEQDETGIVGEATIPQVSDSATTATHSEPATRSFANELSGAMHTAADAWHTRLRDEAFRYRDDQIAAVHERAEAEGVELRAGIDGDLAAADEAASAAIRQIEEEREATVAGLHQVLEERLALHRDVIGREVEAAENEIDAYVAYLDGFFGRLSTETDPEAIVRLAGSIPPLPDLDAATAAARAAAEAELVTEASAVAASPEPAVEAVPEVPQPSRPTPDELVPVMDPDASTAPALADPWLTQPQVASIEEGATIGSGDTSSPEGEPVGAGVESARSSGSLTRLAGFFGRGGETGKEPSTES
jgi:hypothetical protein